MEFTVTAAGYEITTVGGLIGVGGYSGFQIVVRDLKGLKKPETYVTRDEFSTDIVSDEGIRAFLNNHAQGAHTVWFKEATRIAQERRARNPRLHR
jgi:hypothetical protein